MRRANGSTTFPAQNATMAADFEETTEPESHVVITNATLYRLMQRMNARLTALAVSVAILAGSIVLYAIFELWSRPG